MDEWIKGCFKMQLLLLSIKPTDQESAPFKQDFVTLRDPKGRGHATPRGHVGKRGGGVWGVRRHRDEGNIRARTFAVISTERNRQGWLRRLGIGPRVISGGGAWPEREHPIGDAGDAGAGVGSGGLVRTWKVCSQVS